MIISGLVVTLKKYWITPKIDSKIIKRPKNILKDISSSESVWLNAIKSIEKDYKIDIVVGIQPTSPIRESNDFNKTIKFF